MKIATFNINNIRRRLPNLLNWLRETSPDVVCLQELKATDGEFPAVAIKEAGYEAIWRGRYPLSMEAYQDPERVARRPGDAGG